MTPDTEEMILRSIDNTVHLLRIGDNRSGTSELNGLIEHLIIYTDSLKYKPEGHKVVLDINRILPDLIVTMQNFDYVFMCDLLQYELRPLITELKLMKN